MKNIIKCLRFLMSYCLINIAHAEKNICPPSFTLEQAKNITKTPIIYNGISFFAYNSEQFLNHLPRGAKFISKMKFKPVLYTYEKNFCHYLIEDAFNKKRLLVIYGNFTREDALRLLRLSPTSTNQDVYNHVRFFIHRTLTVETNKSEEEKKLRQALHVIDPHHNWDQYIQSRK